MGIWFGWIGGLRIWFGNGYYDCCGHDNGSFGTSVFGWSSWERTLGLENFEFLGFFFNWEKKKKTKISCYEISVCVSSTKSLFVYVHWTWNSDFKARVLTISSRNLVLFLGYYGLDNLLRFAASIFVVHGLLLLTNFLGFGWVNFFPFDFSHLLRFFVTVSSSMFTPFCTTLKFK